MKCPPLSTPWCYYWAGVVNVLTFLLPPPNFLLASDSFVWTFFSQMLVCPECQPCSERGTKPGHWRWPGLLVRIKELVYFGDFLCSSLNSATPQHSFYKCLWKQRQQILKSPRYIYVFYISMFVLLASGPVSYAVAMAGCHITLQAWWSGTLQWLPQVSHGGNHFIEIITRGFGNDCSEKNKATAAQLLPPQQQCWVSDIPSV